MASKITVSKAKTAYGLLSEIAALAIAEPKRIDMARWLVKQVDVDNNLVEAPMLGFPECGTVGCVGGWVDTLKGRSSGHAGYVLGLTSQQDYQLFYPEDPQLYVNGQTPAHARRIAAHIRKFQRKYKAQLLAKKV